MARHSERQEERGGASSGSPLTQQGAGVSAREAYWRGRKALLLFGEVGRWDEIAAAAAAVVAGVAVVAVAAGAVAVAVAGAADAGDGIVAAEAEAVVL